MGFTKVGTGEGKIIDVQSDLAKLGSKVTCCRCKKKFAAQTPDDFVSKVCRVCKRDTREETDSAG